MTQDDPMRNKRRPGHGNADFEGAKDPRTELMGTPSVYGGGDPSFVYRSLRAFFSWLDRRRAPRSSR